MVPSHPHGLGLRIFRHLLKEVLVHRTRHHVSNRVVRNPIIHLLREWFK
jgi:hypothetical protein